MMMKMMMNMMMNDVSPAVLGMFMNVSTLFSLFPILRWQRFMFKTLHVKFPCDENGWESCIELAPRPIVGIADCAARDNADGHGPI